MSADGRQRILRILAILLVVSLSLFIFSIRDRARELAVYGYPGIFLFSLLADGTVLLPAPGLALVFTLGAVLSPIGVSLAAGAGSALGEMSGYLAGFSGRAVVGNVRIYQRITGWMLAHERISYLAILVLALIPNPFFDLAGIAAGALKMPPARFLFWVWIGKTVKMLVIAYLGASSLNFIIDR